ncbi:choice-of-anchor C family protein [Streptomyces sp. NBC_01481]|uniref:choice-of-anchor C family protein n=1 Tax=Streptomyces sp. NBC_01481 TaxID=2975869 RepID=UPI00224DD0F3|nr:choice-of-anchor C family protein [Streptomyces sp. NBC_01481]MCX4588140.1 choice-of-anchor C family protein [Streptomyces sp. NBC_01481]
MLVLRTSLTALTAAAVLLAGAGTALAAPADSSGQASRLAASSTAAVSRFDDGSFETPKVKPNTFDGFAAGQSFGPWKVASGTVDLIGAGYWQAAEGDQSLDLNGNDAGAVSQTFTTRPGTRYTVTYSLAGNPELDHVPPLKTGKVLIDDQNFQDFSFNVTGKTKTNMGYVRRQLTFVATGASTTLTFASTTLHSATGPVIDDVMVERCKPDCCD